MLKLRAPAAPILLAGRTAERPRRHQRMRIISAQQSCAACSKFSSRGAFMRRVSVAQIARASRVPRSEPPVFRTVPPIAQADLGELPVFGSVPSLARATHTLWARFRFSGRCLESLKPTGGEQPGSWVGAPDQPGSRVGAHNRSSPCAGELLWQQLAGAAAALAAPASAIFIVLWSCPRFMQQRVSSTDG